jgi:hypothetical protein
MSVIGLPAVDQFGDAVARCDRRGQCRAAGMSAIFSSEDGKCAVANQL